MSYERALRRVERLTADLAQRNRRIDQCLGRRSSRLSLLSRYKSLKEAIYGNRIFTRLQ